MTSSPRPTVHPLWLFKLAISSHLRAPKHFPSPSQTHTATVASCSSSKKRRKEVAEPPEFVLCCEDRAVDRSHLIVHHQYQSTAEKHRITLPASPQLAGARYAPSRPSR